MRFGSLFAGIGGMDLGLERAGMQVAWQCEIDPFCREVLAERFPGVELTEDIRDESIQWPDVDLICGGPPCQPVSVAGRRAELPAVDGGVLQEDARRRGASQEDRRALAEATEKVRTLTAMVERLQREKDAEVTARRVTHEDNERLRADVWCVRGEQEAARVRAGVLETELKELRAVRDKLDVERAARAQAEKMRDEALVGREKAETERRVAQELREVAQQACRRWQDAAATAQHSRDEVTALRQQLAAYGDRLRAAQSEAEAAKNLAASYLKERDEARLALTEARQQADTQLVDGAKAKTEIVELKKFLDVARAETRVLRGRLGTALDDLSSEEARSRAAAADAERRLKLSHEHVAWLQGKLAKVEAARADAQTPVVMWAGGCDHCRPAPAEGTTVWVAGCGHCGFPTCIEGDGV